MSYTTGELGLARRALQALTAYKEHTWSGAEEASEKTLAQVREWPGWGPLAKALGYREHLNDSWKKVHDDLFELMDNQERSAARYFGIEASDTAFYTSSLVTGAMWDLIRKLDVPAGEPLTFLEPGCGHGGSFIGSTPPDLPVNWVGVEMDPTSAGMAQLLFPRAQIINRPMERTTLREGGVHVAIGNVPFGKDGPFDPTLPEDTDYRPNLHNYFIWRSLMATAPGGLVAVVTSRYTMDSASPKGREFLARYGVFVGAIRLPSTAFKEQGTRVTTDILVLRRRTGDEPEDAGTQWLESSPAPDLTGADDVYLNHYFDSRPHMVLGDLASRGGAQHGMILDVVPQLDEDVPAMMAAAVDALAADARATGLTYDVADGAVSADDAVQAQGSEKEGSFQLDADGAVTQITGGVPVRVRANQELMELILLRDSAVQLLEVDADHRKRDSDVDPLRAHTRKLYEAYVGRYGALQRCTISEGKPDPETGFPTITRRRPSMGGFRQDPDYPMVLALEHYDDDTLEGRPSEILQRRVNRPPVRKAHTDSPQEAISLCRDQAGELDLKVVAKIMRLPTTLVPDALGDLVFQDPGDDGKWVLAAEYLSGDVRAKLRDAQDAAERNPDRWARNVEALLKVQPPDLGPGEIAAKLSSPFIPAKDVAEFIRDLFGADQYSVHVEVRHEPFTALWEVDAPQIRSLVDATTTYGTARVNAVDLIRQALNGTVPVVTDTRTVYEGGRKKEIKVRNARETLVAEERQKLIQRRFAEWLWSDADRTERICRGYNQLYNAYVLRKHDGTGLTFMGLSDVYRPYQHQLDWVAQAISSDGVELNGHAVGAGKTGSAALTAMKLKELGIIRKPLMIVPNHLLEQITGDIQLMFPAKRILMVTREDLTSERRRFFAAKVALNDWDLVIMTHQQFGAIPASGEMETAYLADLLERCFKALHAAKDTKSRAAKQIAKQVRKLRARHAALTSRKHVDPGLTLDMLGVDNILVDEFHYLSRVYTPSRMEGFSMPGSKRAEHLFVALNWLRAKYPSKPVGTLYTGTPVTNTLAEVYQVMRFTMPQRLDELKLSTFDAFAGLFITYASKLEVAPDGSGFRTHRRPDRFSNVPELRLMLNSHSDIRNRESLSLGGPARVNRHKIVTDPVPELPQFIDWLVRRSDAIRSRKPLQVIGADGAAVEDNMLVVCGDGRKASVDPRLVKLAPSGTPLLKVVARAIAENYHRGTGTRFPVSAQEGAELHERPGDAHLAFLDVGTPGAKPIYDDDGNQILDNDKAYGVLRRYLIAEGVQAEHIAFGHDATSIPDRKAQFAAVRDGRIRVLITSTTKGGTGANIQTRLRCLYHIDAPWRPDELEQRDGRAIRPGNLCDEVDIYWFAVQGSFAPYMWQALNRKRTFIDQLFNGEITREVADVISEAALDMANMKAISTGMELVMQLEDAKAQVARLSSMATVHQSNQARIKRDLAEAVRHHQAADSDAKAWRAVASGATDEPVLVSYLDRFPKKKAAGILAEVGRGVRRNRLDTKPGAWRGINIEVTAEWSLTGKREGFRLHGRNGTWTPMLDAPSSYLRNGQEWRFLAAIDEAIDHATKYAASAERRAQYLHKQIGELEKHLGTPFGELNELTAAIQLQEDLEAQIEAELNPTAPAAHDEPIAA